jgi:hypothetical protein
MNLILIDRKKEDRELNMYHMYIHLLVHKSMYHIYIHLWVHKAMGIFTHGYTHIWVHSSMGT